ncbi:MAG: prephenate dehydrogenase [Sulfurimonadaceae bacterium]|nr:prephenate dehydrogenase [Sulfurimonadaceae bacterium]
MKIGIVGLGLMGGSMALSLKELSFVTGVVGSDHNPDHQRIALERNLVDEIVPFETIKRCDVIILSIPVNGVIAALKDMDDIDETTTVIDLGSTKEIIVDAVPETIRKNFVAAHPMTGTENFGPTAAVEGLYKDKVVVLCDLDDSGQQQQEVAVRIFSGLHMQLHYMKAHEHDRHAAFISHMPHVISYSIANTVLAQEDKHNILALAAGGFRSMSRLAKSSPNMWEDIFRQNKENVLKAVDLFETELQHLKQAIKNDEWDEVNQRMKDANKLHDIF